MDALGLPQAQQVEGLQLRLARERAPGALKVQACRQDGVIMSNNKLYNRGCSGMSKRTQAWFKYSMHRCRRQMNKRIALLASSWSGGM